MRYSYEALKEIFDTLAACTNRTPDGYLLDSVSMMPFGDLRGLRGKDVMSRIATLAELGLIELYEFNMFPVSYTKGVRRTPLIRLLCNDFAEGWIKAGH